MAGSAQLEVAERHCHARPASEDSLAGELSARLEALDDVLEILLDLVRRLKPKELEVAHEVVVQREELRERVGVGGAGVEGEE